MESKQSQEWFEIAKKVNTLLTSEGAKERFRERVKEAADEWLRRADDKENREEARREAVEKDGVPLWSGHPSKDPKEGPEEKRKDGSFHWVEAATDEGSGARFSLGAWLPRELSPDLDPDDSLPLPVPAKREVSLAERYAVLAAVWDARWKGGQKIDPWNGEFCREGPFYAMLVDTVKGSTPGHPSDTEAELVRRWIPDVQADLARRTPKKTGKRGPKGPRYDANEDARIYEQWQAFRSGGRVSIETFARKVRGASTDRGIKAVKDALERVRKREQNKVKRQKKEKG